MAEVADGVDAGHARAALQRMQVALQAAEHIAVLRRGAQLGDQAIAVVEQVLAFVDEDIDQLAIEVGEVQRPQIDGRQIGPRGIGRGMGCVDVGLHGHGCRRRVLIGFFVRFVDRCGRVHLGRRGRVVVSGVASRRFERRMMCVRRLVGIGRRRVRGIVRFGGDILQHALACTAGRLDVFCVGVGGGGIRTALARPRVQRRSGVQGHVAVLGGGLGIVVGRGHAVVAPAARRRQRVLAQADRRGVLVELLLVRFSGVVNGRIGVAVRRIVLRCLQILPVCGRVLAVVRLRVGRMVFDSVVRCRMIRCLRFGRVGVAVGR
ncbi:hypothetical protein NB706_003022 [Xanthomonas sacchari]|nr:hypothetical protein [Xanthomonas sacchari]